LFLKVIAFDFEPTLNQQMPVLNQQIIVFLAGGPIPKPENQRSEWE